MKKKPIFVYISGAGKTLESIITNCNNAFVKCVISSNVEAKGLEHAKNMGIHTCVTDNEKPLVTDDLIYLIGTLGKPKLIVLGGYMKILPESFIQFCYTHSIKIINIHPSLLPKYKGLNTHQRVLDAGDDEHGCTIHRVTSKLDSGPIIHQTKFNVLSDDTVESLTETVKIRERIIYPLVIDDMVL